MANSSRTFVPSLITTFQHLIFASKRLDDSYTLSDYNLPTPYLHWQAARWRSYPLGLQHSGRLPTPYFRWQTARGHLYPLQLQPSNTLFSPASSSTTFIPSLITTSGRLPTSYFRQQAAWGHCTVSNYNIQKTSQPSDTGVPTPYFRRQAAWRWSYPPGLQHPEDFQHLIFTGKQLEDIIPSPITTSRRPPHTLFSPASNSKMVIPSRSTLHIVASFFLDCLNLLLLLKLLKQL
jgi:hypothetical protein